MPVVDRLAEACEERARQDHARHRLGKVLRAFPERGPSNERPSVVAARGSAAGDAPDEGDPRRRLRELDPIGDE